MTARLRIDATRCQGHATCFMLAPGLFDVDDEGRGSVLEPELPGHLVEQAAAAVQRCPERAIILD
jgi:ferredoxin